MRSAGEGAASAGTRPHAALRLLLRAPAHLYRWRCGWLLGHRFLMLNHTGRRTGRRRSTVLEVVEYRRDGPEAVVISARGRNADWLCNIEAARRAEVVIATQRFAADYRTLSEDEVVEVLIGYQRRNRLAAPVIRLVLSRLLGWKFDGSPAHCRRLALQLPLIVFRPVEAFEASG